MNSVSCVSAGESLWDSNHKFYISLKALGCSGNKRSKSTTKSQAGQVCTCTAERWGLWHHAEQHDLQTALLWTGAAQRCTVRRVNSALKLLFSRFVYSSSTKRLLCSHTLCFSVKVNANTVMQRSILRAARRVELSHICSLVCFLSASVYSKASLNAIVHTKAYRGYL